MYSYINIKCVQEQGRLFLLLELNELYVDVQMLKMDHVHQEVL